jgi:hypothetical protein
MSEQLLVIIDPAARQTDGESVRIAKDVLSAGAAAKVCLPDGPEEFARALDRRGSRRPVVVGDGHALMRAVTLLHRARELAGCALSVVPVGDTGLAESLGVPGGAVAAARAVLDGAERRLDLLVDDSDGVVLSGLGIPPEPVVRAAAAEPVPVAAGRAWYRSLVRTLAPRPPRLAAVPAPGPSRFRVEVDGETVVDLGQPVEAVTVAPGPGGRGGGDTAADCRADRDGRRRGLPVPGGRSGDGAGAEADVAGGGGGLGAGAAFMTRAVRAST